jgi:hypothetical protein
MTGTLDLLDHEPPPGRALEREIHLIDTVELQKPLPHRSRAAGATRPRDTSPLTTSTIAYVIWRR